MNIEERIKQKCANFDNLTEEDCVEIVLSAKALSLDEILQMLLIDKSDFSEAEDKFANMLFLRGRAIGIKDAADKLFANMSTRTGGQAALDYLKQMSGEFQVEVAGTTNTGFQFNVSIPQPGKKAEAKVSTGS